MAVTVQARAPGVERARKVALLLDDPGNRYQQLLVQQAGASAERHGIQLFEPEFARGSSWTQVESVNRHLRETRPDAILVMMAGGQWTRAPFERVARAGVAVVFLNRIPDWVEELRRDHERNLVAGVTPLQAGVGEIQGHQAMRLARTGAFVILITGDATSPAAIARRRGFLDTVADRFAVHELDGRWSAAGARKALGEWFHLGAERDRPVDLVVCQNDAMASGAREALATQAAGSGRPELAQAPLLGCDGLEEEGRLMVARGLLAATVVMPVTTPSALEVLRSYWDTGARPGIVSLEARSHPDLDALGQSPLTAQSGSFTWMTSRPRE